MRIKKYLHGRYEQKITPEKQEKYFKKIDLLFNMIEKISIFHSGFKGFRKHKYMSIFSLSEGFILSQDKLFKQKYSIYSPELVLCAERRSKEFYDHAEIESFMDGDFNPKELLGRLHMLSELMNYDKKNPSYYSPFFHLTFD